MAMEKIEWDGKTLALILRQGLETEGANFFTEKENPFQLGILAHRKGVELKPHIHKVVTRTIKHTQEVLHILYGTVEVDFYDEKGEKVKSSILNTGDTILLISGGHGFKMLQDARMLEIKQGPYVGIEEDKHYFS